MGKTPHILLFDDAGLLASYINLGDSVCMLLFSYRYEIMLAWHS